MREDQQDDPEPTKHSDAERVTSENVDEAPQPEELEDDPTCNPEEKPTA
jgi:hypothetical protein